MSINNPTNDKGKKILNYNHSLSFIAIAIFIDALGLGIFIPIFPELMQEITQKNLSTITIYSGLLTFAYSMMQFIFAPIMGALSDKYGRKPVLIISLAALGVDYVVMGLAQSLIWLFIARIISGIMGASFSTATAYIADISDEESRTKNFGIIQAAFGGGFIFGPMIGGLLGTYGTRVPLFFAAILTFGNVIFGIWKIKESLKEKNTQSLRFKGINPIGSILTFKNNKILMFSILSLFLMYLSVTSYHNVWNFFLIEKFQWGPKMIGLSLGCFGASMIIMQGFVLKPLIKIVGNTRVIIYGLLISVLSYFMFAFVGYEWMVFALAPIIEIGWLGVTALNSMAAGEISATQQGKLQGIISSLIGITNIIGPLIMTGSFYLFSRSDSWVYLPGFPFILSGFLCIISLIIVKFKVLNKIGQSNK